MYRFFLKNVLSSFIALLIVIVFWPVYAAIAIWIKVDDPHSPVLFKQKRIGIHKTEFNIYKFRTMRTDTPHDVPTHMMTDPEQYLTKPGRFLRRHSLDELPQVFNILKLRTKTGYAEMTWVGPRPALWNQYDLIEERDKYGANDVYPGLIGWAQVNGRDALEIPIKAKYDGYYAHHIGPAMDFKCIRGAIGVVFYDKNVIEGGTGAMELPSARPKMLIATNHSYMLWRFRRELIEELMKDRDVVLAMPFVGHEQDFMDMGLKCIDTPIARRNINPFKDLALFKQYRKIFSEEAPNQVITYSIKSNIYAGYVAAHRYIPYYVNVQGTGTAFQKKWLAPIVTVMYRTALKRAEKVFFENQANLDEFLNRKIIPEQKAVLLSGAGINLETYLYSPYPGNETVHFLYLGGVMKEKGMDELLYSIRKLREEGRDCVLDVVGFYDDEENYEQQVAELEQLGVAKYHGFQEEPRPYYQMADCVVLPSYHEGMSNVLLEAAATGRPLITSDIPGCKESVENGLNGYLVKVKSKTSLLAAMRRFMNLSVADREQMGRAGRSKMEKDFAKEMVVEMTVRSIEI